MSPGPHDTPAPAPLGFPLEARSLLPRVRDVNPKGAILDRVRPASLRAAAEFQPDPSEAQGDAQPERKKHRCEKLK